MPYGDGTGPYGTGPVGWRRGPCANAGRSNWPAWRGVRARLSPEEERAYLLRDKRSAEESLIRINRRLKTLAQKVTHRQIKQQRSKTFNQ